MATEHTTSIEIALSYILQASCKGKGEYMSEGVIWILIIWNLIIVLEHEWQLAGKGARHDKRRKGHKKSRKAPCDRGCGHNISLVWNDMDRMHGDYK